MKAEKKYQKPILNNIVPKKENRATQFMDDNRPESIKQAKLLNAIHTSQLRKPDSLFYNSVLQLAPVETSYGIFNDESYTEINNDEKTGVNIKLTFDPSTANATKIGMVQSVKSYKDNQAIVMDDRQKPMVTADGYPFSGYKIDRLFGHNNPIYGSDNLKSTDDLTKTEKTDVPGHDVGDNEDDAKYKLGFRYENKGVWEKEKAEMYDTPGLFQPPINSGQIFETTALAIDGCDKNRYYGSVKWGWTKDGTGAYTKLLFEKVSDGTPSKNFTEAAKLWNSFNLTPKILSPDENHNTTTTEDIKVKIDDISFNIASGSSLEIDLTQEGVGNSMLAILTPTILLKAGSSYWTCWLPVNIIDQNNKLIQDQKVLSDERLYKKGDFTVCKGTKVSYEPSKKVNDEALMEIQEGKLIDVDLGSRLVWIEKQDALGLSTTNLPD